MDLRIRVASLFEEATSCALSERFAVSGSWVRKLRLRHRAGQGLEPREKGHRPRKIDVTGEEQLRHWLSEEPDATIGELCERYERERGVAVPETTMRNTLSRMGMSRKKRRSSRQNETANASSRHATHTTPCAPDGTVGA